MRAAIFPPFVAVVDDSAEMREALQALLNSAGFAARGYASAEAFLDAGAARRAGCLILDARLPGMSGRDLQRRLRAEGSRIPIIFISAHDEGAGGLQTPASRDGAIAFLRKPFCDTDLLSALRSAFGMPRSMSRFQRQT